MFSGRSDIMARGERDRHGCTVAVVSFRSAGYRECGRARQRKLGCVRALRMLLPTIPAMLVWAIVTAVAMVAAGLPAGYVVLINWLYTPWFGAVGGAVDVGARRQFAFDLFDGVRCESAFCGVQRYDQAVFPRFAAALSPAVWFFDRRCAADDFFESF